MSQSQLPTSISSENAEIHSLTSQAISGAFAPLKMSGCLVSFWFQTPQQRFSPDLFSKGTMAVFTKNAINPIISNMIKTPE